MKNKLYIQNSLSRQKELFKPITEGFIGMYVCGPTVYSDVHIGNCRTFISFDVIYRYLKYIGYNVRYVRNITDVGHLTDEGEDKMSKGAKLAKLEPMEIAQKYTVGFHKMMQIFNTLPPSIEPRATGHIPEQINLIKDIIKNDFAYISNGSVYFDTPKYDQCCREDSTFKISEHYKSYGGLSGQTLGNLISETRELNNQSEKKDPSDFAIWVKAKEDDLQFWDSPWSKGYPGWHLECSAMSKKYLGDTFDIHGGGNDLKFPHHENEIAQSIGACKCEPAKTWIHTNMLEMNGRKMSKSDGNTITPAQLFSGDSPHISKAYSPMVVKFFMLLAHYGSTLDITDKGLHDAEKVYKRLMEANKVLSKFIGTNENDGSVEEQEINELIDYAFEDMNDNFNTARAISRLIELSKKINTFNTYYSKDHKITVISKKGINRLKEVFNSFIQDIFGLLDEAVASSNGNGVTDGLMQLVIDLRQNARATKDWGTSDKIRDSLNELNIKVKDGKEGTTWSKN